MESMSSAGTITQFLATERQLPLSLAEWTMTHDGIVVRWVGDEMLITAEMRRAAHEQYSYAEMQATIDEFNEMYPAPAQYTYPAQDA